MSTPLHDVVPTYFAAGVAHDAAADAASSDSPGVWVNRRPWYRGSMPRPFRFSSASILVILVFVFAFGPAASAATSVASWEMNETAGSRTLRDNGPDRLDGTIGTSVVVGPFIDGAVGQRRSTVAPDTSPLDPERLAVVPDDDRLDPGDGNHVVSVRLRTDQPDGNMVQKGQTGVEGGFFKLEINRGNLTCLHRGPLGTVSVTSGPVADGAWHSVSCSRGASSVDLIVDGSVVARKDGPIGPTNNTSPLTIGGKLGCDQRSVGCDYFSGDIDWVRIGRGSGEVPAPVPPTTTAPPQTEPPTTVADVPATSVAPSTNAVPGTDELADASDGDGPSGVPWIAVGVVAVVAAVAGAGFVIARRRRLTD